MEIILAEFAGFCLGVQRAVSRAEEVATREGRVYTLGPLIHNPQEVARLADNGISVVDGPDAVDSGTLVIRAHGAPPEVYKAAEERGLSLVDATCPFVLSLQRKAAALADAGYQVVIIGDPRHPEMQGVVGWTNGRALVISGESDVDALGRLGRIGVVAQTTFRNDVLEALVERLRAKAEEVLVERTICRATAERQEAARTLARNVQLMVVVGGRSSSNTQKLVSICHDEGAVTHHIETAADLDPLWFEGVERVGVTAGASTPDWIVKEVIRRMEELESKPNEPEAAGAANEPARRRAREREAWQELEGKVSPDGEVEGVVTAAVKGGLSVDVFGVRAFMPASQIERGFVKDLNPYVGERIRARVIELDSAKRRLVLSRRALIEGEKTQTRERILAEIAAGQTRRGVVKGITDFGAFVDLGGIDGLLHVSQMGWSRVGHPSDVVSVGDELTVSILKVDAGSGKISLGLKQVQGDPWAGVAERYKAGSVVDGKVVRIVPFGVFVEVEPGVEGLVHVSQVADHRVNDPSEAVQEGERVRIRILKVDAENRRISLSLREEAPAPRPARIREGEQARIRDGGQARPRDGGQRRRDGEQTRTRNGGQTRRRDGQQAGRRGRGRAEGEGRNPAQGTGWSAGPEQQRVTLGDVFGDLLEATRERLGGGSDRAGE